MACNFAPHLGLRMGPERPATDAMVPVAKPMAPRERIRRALRRHGALTIEGIAEASGLAVETVRPLVHEMRREEQLVREQTYSLAPECAR